ncbi:MAG: ATP-binding protein [Pseudomonadota bacterium]
MFRITSLRHKFVLGAATGLVSLSLALVGLAVALYQYQLAQERSQASNEVNRLLQAALENAMLKRDLPGLRDIVARMGRQSGVLGAMIVAPAGEIRFASNPALLGQTFPLEPHGLCLDCPAAARPLGLTTLFTRDALGREVMRSLNPVANRPPCTGCHGQAATRPLNGVMVVDYDAAPIRHQAALSAATLAGMGGLLLLASLLGGAWFIHHYVLRPVARLSAASHALASGHLEGRANLEGGDELAQLGRTFDEMAENLQSLVRRIQEQETFLQALVDAIPDGIRVIDRETLRIVLDNRAYREQIGLPPGQSHSGVPCHVSSHGQGQACAPTLMLCPVHEIEHTGRACKTLMTFTRAEGGKRHVEVFAAPLDSRVEGRDRRYVVESSRDLDQALKFSQEQKLAEMARLATGVAHEIHNPLASIRIALHAMLRAAEQEPERLKVISDYLGMVDGEIDRCIAITESLLKLGMAPSPTPQLVEVNPAVSETLSLLDWEAGERKVAVVPRLATPSPRILASDTELRTLVLNLAQNAFHAMPQGGRLEVSTRQAGDWVEIELADTGVGITPEDARHIFDPFFSRRADGQRGTGLGLSICRSIVEALGGSILVDSEPGRGSRFTLRLPDAATRVPA